MKETVVQRTKLEYKTTGLSHAVFTNEDLSNIPIMTSDATPSISFSAHGIQVLLENLVLGKAPGPDGLTTYIFKHCASKIAPILQMLFTQSLNTGTLP